jgi:tetratricopeptide (TPR) repeat protein
MNRWLRLHLGLPLCFVACGGTAPLAPAAVAHNSAGAWALQQGDLETAGARLEVALEYHPEFVEALANLGLVELGRGNFARSRQLLERAVRLNQDLAQPHHGLGVLAEREHRPDLASEHYREALRVDPGFGAARGNLARLLLHAGQIEHALLQFQKLRQVDPTSLVGHSGSVECLLTLGRILEAQALLHAARAELGEQPTLTVLQARLWLRSGESERAASALEPLTSGNDDTTVSALAWLSVAYLSRGHVQAALDAAERALALDPEHPLSTFAAGLALDELHDPQRVAWLERALLLNPNNPELLRRLGRASPR